MKDRRGTKAPDQESSSRDGQTKPILSFPVVGVGASAGGLEAVSQFLRPMSGESGMAVVVIQHLDPTHESSLAELLSRVCPMPVCQAKEGLVLQPDHVYVIPPNAGMILKDGSLHLTPRDETQEARRPIDLFLRSLADEAGPRSLGVVLSGTGSDGTLGLQAIRAAGGITFAQDASAAYDGMPGSAIAAGCVDYILPPGDIAAELTRVCGGSTPGGLFPTAGSSDGAGDDRAFLAVIQSLSKSTGVDFANYKPATLRRRISRRMLHLRIDRLDGYLAFLEQDSSEADVLFRDVLINVTSFFRDKEVFEALKEVVFPALLKDRPSDQPIRIWVPGCATGEEVYSLAICLLEFLGSRNERVPIKLFGTDVSESVVAHARAGHFREGITADVSPARLKRFFVREETGGYLISKAVREMCVFARQDATRDPPFSKLDLISCRNVLIYLGPVLQKRVFPLFHFALNQGGFLVLGSSESVGQMGDLFTVLDSRQRIHVRKSVPSRLVFETPSSDRRPIETEARDSAVVPAPSEIEFRREADRILLALCAPAGVLIDENLEILQFRGSTGPFLRSAPGTPSNNLRSMARSGLYPDLGEVIEEARTQKSAVRREGLRISTDHGEIDASVEVIPIQVPLSAQLSFLVLFEEIGPDGSEPARRTRRPERRSTEHENRRIAQLERELASSGEYLRAALEEREATTEELRAANEELLSSNEELLSTNEELQTAHEELQATNEELVTVNEELQHRNEEAALLANDLSNLLSSVNIPIVMLGLDLCIRRFTPTAAKLLNLIPSDLGRPILDLKPKIDIPDLGDLLTEVLESSQAMQRDVQDLDGIWHTLWIGPYRCLDQRIDGVVIVLNDVDAIKRSADRLAAALEFAESIVMTVREPLLVLDHELRTTLANDAFRETFGDDLTDTFQGEGADSSGGRWSLPGLRDQLSKLLAGEPGFEEFQVTAEVQEIGRRVLLMNARLVRGGSPAEPRILLVIEDVTERRLRQERDHQREKGLEATQRLESLGVMAGGIAHDFNNVLTVILGYASFVRQGLSSDSPLRPYVEEIEKSGFRAADLCSQMLAYSGMSSFEVQSVCLSALVAKLRPLLKASTSKKTVLRFHLAEDLPAIMADTTQIHQVAMNLVINASEAAGGGPGSISVTTGQMRPDQAYLAAARLVPDKIADNYVFLEVRDDGCGMDPETLARAFEPFFTRKFTGRGLGLSAVLGIIRGHHGILTVESAPEQGTTFRVLFPQADGPLELPSPPSVPEADWCGEGTVLVVDDEERLRVLLKNMLERLGFQVLLAADGQEALEVFQAKASEIDLVMVDLTMPRMDGAEVFRKLIRAQPDVRVILMSGFDEKSSLDSLGSPGPACFLQKPFQLSDVSKRLRLALGVD